MLARAFDIDDVALLPSGWLTTRFLGLDVRTLHRVAAWIVRLPPAAPGRLATHFDIVRTAPYEGAAALGAALFVDLMREQARPFTLHVVTGPEHGGSPVRVGFAGRTFVLGAAHPDDTSVGAAIEPDAVLAHLAAASVGA